MGGCVGINGIYGVFDLDDSAEKRDDSEEDIIKCNKSWRNVKGEANDLSRIYDPQGWSLSDVN